MNQTIHARSVPVLISFVLAVSTGCSSNNNIASATQGAATTQPASAATLLPITGKATASSTEDGNPPQNAADGDMETRWCAVDGTVPQSWRMDFDAPVDLKGITIHWEHDTTGYDYIVEGSTDGTIFTTLSDQSKNTFEGGTQSITFDKTARGLKSFRISVSGLQDGSWASIWEVDFKR